MEKNITFNYTYSAADRKEVQEIRKKYLPREESKYDELRRLDQQVQSAGILQSLIIGIGGFLLFGLGVCLMMKVIGESVLTGFFLGIIGFVGMFLAYPVYRSIFSKAREKYVPRILQLSAELISEKGVMKHERY